MSIFKASDAKKTRTRKARRSQLLRLVTPPTRTWIKHMMLMLWAVLALRVALESARLEPKQASIDMLPLSAPMESGLPSMTGLVLRRSESKPLPYIVLSKIMGTSGPTLRCRSRLCKKTLGEV